MARKQGLPSAEEVAVQNMILERIKTKFGCRNDKEMGNIVGVTDAQISYWRTGRSHMGLGWKLIAMERLGYRWAVEAMKKLSPETLKDELRRRFDTKSGN